MNTLQDLLSSPWLAYGVFALVPLVVLALFLLSKPFQILTIARNTFVESVRQPIYFILIVLCGILQVFNVLGSAYSMGYTETTEVSGDNKLLLDIGLATIFVCGTLLAGFIATAVISREIENKTVLTVVSKPISRQSVVLGKFLGVTGAIVIATLTMVLFLLLGIRHGVMSTAADDPDMPVILFAGAAVLVAMGIAVWCNFFYGWVFTQTATMLMFPFLMVAYVLVLLVNKKWGLQDMSHDFKPQLTIACLSVVLALVVLSSVATAASARLGQVMTIVICAGVFMFGLLSNHFLGSRAFHNDFVGRIEKAIPVYSNQAALTNPGDSYTVTLEFDPRVKLDVGMPFYYSPNPNGFPLSTLSFRAPDRSAHDFSKLESTDAEGVDPALVLSASQGRSLTVRRVGPAGPIVRFAPEPGDYVFNHPTKVSAGPLTAWGLVPNVQFFWLVDAITQNQPIPISHLALIMCYAVAQVGVFLSLAVMLFQTREVG